jgi:hypothetical protein
MVATMLLQTRLTGAAPNLAKLASRETRERRHTEIQRCPRAGSDQREPSSPRFEPRPLFLLGRGSKRGTPTAA